MLKSEASGLSLAPVKGVSCMDGYDPNALRVDKACEAIRKCLAPVGGIERVATRSALGRLLAEDIVPQIDVPAHDNSAMDGYALRAADLAAGGETTLKEAGTSLAGKKFPGTMGMVYTGSGYDTVQILAKVWASVDPSDFDGVGKAIKAITHRGVCGTYTFANAEQTPLSYPNMTDDAEAGQAHLIFQVQDGAHTIISPASHKQADLRPAPWM